MPVDMQDHDAVVASLGTTDWWAALRSGPEEVARAVCHIDVVRLDRTLERHASLRAWITAAHEVARVEEEKAKWNVTRTRALRLLAAKAEPDPQSKKPKTVAVLEAEVDTAEEVQKAMADYLEAQQSRSILRALVDSLEDRKDMLIQLSARQRSEQSRY